MNLKILKKFTYEKIACPLCKSKDCETLRQKGMFDIFINLSICKRCGFLYLNPRWKKKYYTYFYKKLYDYYFDRTTNHTSECKKYSIILNRIKKIALFSKNQKLNILDIGAGMGAGLLLFRLKYKGSDLFAIEPSPQGFNNFKKKNIKSISNDVDSNWEKVNYKFDLIIMRHVLEHLLHPEETLSKIYNTLSNFGYFYVAVPNFFCAESLITKNFFRVVHTLYFSKKSLNFFLGNNGFKIIKITEEKDGEVYAICKKKKKKKKKIPNLNDFSLSKRKLLNIWKNLEL